MSDLFRRQAANEVDKMPAVCIGKRGLEGWHARAGEPVRDPFEKLGVCMNPDDGVMCQIGGARVKGHADKTIAFASLSVAISTISTKQCLDRVNRFGFEMDTVVL